ALIERAAVMAGRAGHTPEAIANFEEALSLFEAAGLTHPAARVSARMSALLWQGGRPGEGGGRLEPAFEDLSERPTAGDTATLTSELARALYFSGHPDLALERIDYALGLAEALDLPEVLSNSLNTKAIILYAARGRRREAAALLRHALDIALEADIPAAT